MQDFCDGALSLTVSDRQFALTPQRGAPRLALSREIRWSS